MPLASAELSRLRKRAMAIEQSIARRQALASLRDKAFHVHGACLAAVFLPADLAARYVRLVATFETAVDYLDNLSDRAGKDDEADLRALHESLADAVTPAAAPRAYFRERAYDDGGYLEELVRAAQRCFAGLPSFCAVASDIAQLTQRYCELQALKHLPAGRRELRCSQAFGGLHSGLRWWEAAAACGSTMPTFALVRAALRPNLTAAQSAALRDAYFPYFSGLHILLDYFIDQAEDNAHGELNFVACYPSRDAAAHGIASIAQHALRRIERLPEAEQHTFVLRAMCAFYCTRPKVARQALSGTAQAIMRAVGMKTVAPLGRLLKIYAQLARS
jgi:tetraprenyl-beta-curcumene synthase